MCIDHCSLAPGDLAHEEIDTDSRENVLLQFRSQVSWTNKEKYIEQSDLGLLDSGSPLSLIMTTFAYRTLSGGRERIIDTNSQAQTRAMEVSGTEYI